MTRLKHLLLVSQTVENEQALFDWTLELAARHHAKVTVLRVLPEVDVGLMAWFKEVVPEELMERETQGVFQSFKDWESQANQADITLETKVEFGKVFYQAILQVLKEPVDLIIKQTDEEIKDLSSHIFGSHDLHLLRKCPCPVLLHKQGANLPFKNVMASIDIDIEDESLQADDFNQAILGLSVQVAKMNQANLKVVHAWQADAENLVHYWNSDLSDADLFEFTESVRRQHANALEYDIETSRNAFPNLEVIMPKGRAVEAIPLVVEQNQVDLLVMGTLGRNGLPGIIIGNTSESILEKVSCSVLALKPNNFVSPISINLSP